MDVNLRALFAGLGQICLTSRLWGPSGEQETRLYFVTYLFQKAKITLDLLGKCVTLVFECVTPHLYFLPLSSWLFVSLFCFYFL